VAALSAPASVNEGSAAAFDASGSTDVDAGDAAGFKYVWNFGDGSPAVTTTTAQQSHVYADNGAYTVTLFVYDPAGASGKATSVVTVNNVAPAVMFGSLMSLTLESGDPIAASGSFTDPGPDSPWNASINWGDGTTNSPIPSSFSRSGSSMLGGSRYFVPGTYNATLSVTDKDGGVGTSSFVVTVNRRDIRADVNPAKIKLSDNGGDNVDVMLYSDLLAHMSDLDVASAKIGTVGVNVKNNGKFDADVELLGVRIRLRFSRQALIAAGVLGAGTTNMDLVANLTNGIQIIAHVPVTTTN
jgi:PKD repeat protein